MKVMDAEIQPFKKGMIILWYGTPVRGPVGWAFCNGGNGTPDLRHKFIRGMGGADNMGEEGGSDSHSHVLTGMDHSHQIEAGNDIAAGGGYGNYTAFSDDIGSIDSESNLPRYYVLNYIMKL